MIVIQPVTFRAGMIISLIGCLLFFQTPLTSGEDGSSGLSVGEPLLIQGIVKRISPKKQTITLKPGKQARIKIKVDEQTDFTGMAALEELKRGQRVKVQFTVIDGENRAVKIERLPDLGC